MADFYGEKECGPTHFACDCQIKRMAELERKLEKAKVALEFYARHGDVCVRHSFCNETAREALKEIEG